MNFERINHHPYSPNEPTLRLAETVFHATPDKPLEYGVAVSLFQGKQIREYRRQITGTEETSLYDFGTACGHSLYKKNSIPNTPEELAERIYTLRYPDNRPIGSASLTALSLILLNIPSVEIRYRVLQKGMRLAEDQIAILQQYSACYFSNGIYPGIETIDYNPDNIFPFLYLYQLPHEETDPFFESLEVAMRDTFVSYGGINADVLYHAGKQTGESAPSAKAEICPKEDEVLGLHMPFVWYFNSKGYKMGTAMYYNNIQLRKLDQNPEANINFRQLFGTVCFVECYSIEKLREFAQRHNFTIFSTPFDLVNTIRFIVRSLDYLKEVDFGESDSKFLKFIDKFLDFTATKTQQSKEHVYSDLNKMEVSERFRFLLQSAKSFWQQILIPKGIDANDEEILLAAGENTPTVLRNLGVSRKPCIVFMGANVDPLSERKNDEIVVINNRRLAQMQYDRETRIIAPLFKDSQNHLFRPHFLLVKSQGKSADVAILNLLVLREIGEKDKYHSFRSRYEELARRTE